MPPVASLGLAKVPLLSAVALYYALTYPRGTAVTAAILAGLIQDSMSLLPIGYSSLCFALFALILAEVRGTLESDSIVTTAVLGGLLAALTTLGLYAMLSVNSLVADLPLGWVMLKTGGNALLGLVAAPVVCWAALTLERLVGLTPLDERGGL